MIPTATTEFEVRMKGYMDVKVDIGRHGIPMLSLTTQVRLDACRKMQGVTRVMAEIRLFAECENERVGCWEPVN